MSELDVEESSLRRKVSAVRALIPGEKEEKEEGLDGARRAVPIER